MNVGGPCAAPPATARCKLEIAEPARKLVDTGEDRTVARRRVLAQVADWLEDRTD